MQSAALAADDANDPAADRNAPASVFVEYEALAGDPAGQACRLAAVLDRHCGGITDEMRTARMAGTCDPLLWRNRAGTASSAAEMTPAQTALYQLLRARARDARVRFGEHYPLPTGWRTLILSEEQPRSADR